MEISDPAKATRKLPMRPICFALALLIFIVATISAIRQSPRSDPLNAPAFFSIDWWKYPLEINAIRRLSLISANIRDILYVAQNRTLWVVGAGGLIASSADD